jgi:hypothetical protein
MPYDHIAFIAAAMTAICGIAKLAYYAASGKGREFEDPR